MSLRIIEAYKIKTGSKVHFKNIPFISEYVVQLQFSTIFLINSQERTKVQSQELIWRFFVKWIKDKTRGKTGSASGQIFSFLVYMLRVRLVFLKCYRENLSFRNFKLGEKRHKHIAQQIFPDHRTMYFSSYLKQVLSETAVS